MVTKSNSGSLSAEVKNDMVWSEKVRPNWDQYYKTDEFKELLKKLYKRDIVGDIKIDRSENYLFQIQSHLDAIISFGTGSCLLIDEKSDRFNQVYDQNLYIVEVANPKNTINKDGWGYDRGRTIAHVRADPETGKFVQRPIFYNICEHFINNVVRSDRFKKVSSHSSSKTRCILVPKEILEQYFP